MSLLQQAKQIQVHHYGKKPDYSDEELEVVVAWLSGDIRHTQAAQVLVDNGTLKKKTGFAVWTYVALQEAYKRGMIRKATPLLDDR